MSKLKKMLRPTTSREMDHWNIEGMNGEEFLLLWIPRKESTTLLFLHTLNTKIELTISV